MTYPNRLKAVEEALEAILPARPLELQIGGQQGSIAQRWLYFREYTGPSPKGVAGQAHSGGAGSTVCGIAGGQALGASGLDRRLAICARRINLNVGAA